MKISLMKLKVIWRRFRRNSPEYNDHHLRYVAQIEALMRRADPFASWNERANWMIDIAQWLRMTPRDGMPEAEAWERLRHQRTRFLLDWLDRNRDTKRVVQATLQKTLREAVGPELFCVTGLPREPAFFSELWERIIRMLLPRPLGKQDLSTLFTAMFPKSADADWLLGLDQHTLTRIWKLCADEAIAHNYRQQIDEALTYLVSMIIAVGVGSEFRQRLEPRMPLQATPFFALRRELEKYLLSGVHDESCLRSVRMLIAVCHAQTDRIYADLDEHGVSVSLVYRVERMRAQLNRMSRLIDLRSALRDEESAAQMHALLIDLIEAHHHRSSVQGLTSRSFSLLARKMVERNADHGAHYIARDRTEYRAMFKAAARGGTLTAFTVLVKSFLPAGGAARFFEGAFASLNYASSFLLISAVGGTLATKQPAITAPALAAKMQSLDTIEGLRKLMQEIAYLLRSQAAAVFGNLIAVIPAMLVISLVFIYAIGSPVMDPGKAMASINSFSLVGPTLLYAAFTGVLLWISSLAAGFADNWFALRKVRESITHHRRLVHALGTTRAQRCAKWVESHVASVSGNVSLAVLLGMSPVLAQFFGLPLDVRHVTLATGTLTAAVASLGWHSLLTPEFWLAVFGILGIGVLNVGVAFACALALALRARDVPRRVQRLVYRAVLRRLAASPWLFLFPEQREAGTDVLPTQPAAEQPPQERRTGSDR